MAVIGTTELAANLGYLMATTMETLRDRRGEMTFNGTKEDGWWVRYTHDRFGLDGFTAETDGFQFGYEWMKPEEGGKLFRGAALDVAQGDVDYDNLSGESEADRYRLSAYQTYMGDNGVYYDAVLRAGWYDAETNVAYTRDNGTVYDMRATSTTGPLPLRLKRVTASNRTAPGGSNRKSSCSTPTSPTTTTRRTKASASTRTTRRA